MQNNSSSVWPSTRRVFQRAFIYLLLIVGIIFAAGPLLWMVSSSLKDLRDVFAVPPRLIPDPAIWQNYLEAWNTANFSLYLANSIFVAVVVTLGQLATGALAAFAFARIEFRGKNLLFYLVLGTLMIPSEMLLVPNYVILKELSWLNTRWALTVPLMAGALAIFLLRQQFMTIPRELEEAATIDGCSRFRFFWSIVLPNSRPALSVVTVFTFITNWNSYIWPLIVTRDDNLRTIQVGLSAFKDAMTSGANTQWHLLLAASSLALLPVLLIYLFAERWFTQGFLFSGIDG
jgi:multiple sugar transport system permease protein